MPVVLFCSDRKTVMIIATTQARIHNSLVSVEGVGCSGGSLLGILPGGWVTGSEPVAAPITGKKTSIRFIPPRFTEVLSALCHEHTIR